VSERTLGDRFREHGRHHHDALYRVLLANLADDWDAGGVTRTICAGWGDSPTGTYVELRLLAGLHRIVLTGRAPELVPYYPNRGGSAAPDEAWPVVQPVMAAHVRELRAALHIAPQTNEPGRSAALLVGLFHAVRESGLRRIRLLEPGASAGLNLLVDQFRIGGDGWWSGPADSPLVLDGAVLGEVTPVDYQIVSRRGCDLEPVDPTSTDGQLRLTSFVWPHQLQRHARLRAALQIAEREPVVVDRSGAANWLESQLLVADPEVLTIVWHSVTRLYWPTSETERVGRLVAEAGERMPIAHIAMEYPVAEAGQAAALTVDLIMPRRDQTSTVVGTVERTGGPMLVGTVADHGVPVRAGGQSSRNDRPARS
jgi:hypothetical protein